LHKIRFAGEVSLLHAKVKDLFLPY